MAIAFVAKLIGQGQTISGTPTSFTSNALTNGASVGDLVVVNVYTGNNVDSGGMTISDSSGNTWTKQLYTATDGLRALQAYCILTTALTTSSTFTIGGLNSNSNKRIVLIAAAFSGVSAVDISGTFEHSSVSESLTTASDLMVTFSGTSGDNTTTITPASGFTEVDDISPSYVTLEMAYRINAFSAGSYTYTPTYNSDGGSTKRATRILTFTETAGVNISVNAECPNVAIAGTTIPSVHIIAETIGTPYKLHADADFTADYARIAGEGWTYTSNGGAPHYQDVDESVVDFTDYITMSGTQSSNNYWYYNLEVEPYVGHGGLNDPGTGKGHILRFAYEIVTSSVSSGQNAGIWLYSGSTYIGQYSNTQFGLNLDNQGDPIIFQLTLPDADANAINDYSNLYFVPFIIGSTTETVDMRWHWFELEIPEVQVTGGLAFNTNVGVTGFAPTISTTSSVSVSQDTTDVNVIGHDSTINIVNPTLVNPVITNISLDGQDATISVTSNISVAQDTTDINILGHNADLAISGSFIDAPETGLITLDAHDATVTIINPTIVNVTSSNISLDAKNTSSLYFNAVSANSPVHWWRLTEETSPTLISDEGSNPISGTSNVVQADYIYGIPGAWSDGKEALTLGGSISPKGIKFNTGLPIANNPNITLEFWVYPGISTTASAFVNTFNNASAGPSGGTDVRTTIGLYQGQAAVLRLYKTVPNGLNIYEVTTVSNNIISNKWNHIVLTKSTSGQTATYKSYVNSVETATPLSIGTFFYFGDNNIEYQSLGTAVDLNNAFTPNVGFPGTAIFDEFAVYDTALSLGQIQEHYTSGLLGPLNTTVSVDHTDIFVSGISSGSSPSANASISNIGIIGRNPSINITGAPTIITNAPNIGIDAQDTTVNTDGSKTISVQKSNIDISINLPKVRTRIAEFIFVNKNDVSLSAINSTEITEIDFGGLLYNQIKKDLFKIGNTSDFICSFNISVFSKETQVISAVQLSTDNFNYSDTLYIENIAPNNMSDNIYVKFDVNALDVLGPGTFLINVEQIYVI